MSIFAHIIISQIEAGKLYGATIDSYFGKPIQKGKKICVINKKRHITQNIMDNFKGNGRECA